MHRLDTNPTTGLLEVFDAVDALVPRLTRPANLMVETHIAQSVVRPYLRGALRAFDHHDRTIAAGRPVHSPWGPPHEVRALLEETLRDLGARLEMSREEPGVVLVRTDPDRYDEVARLVFGIAHLYDALARCGYYLLGNPFVIPRRLRRSMAVIPRILGGRGAATSRRREAKLYFRIVDRQSPGPRMEDPTQIDRILPALTAYGVPAPVYQLFATMIEGLARVGEQYPISLLDWWEPSGAFGTAIATTSKGSRRVRNKLQVITEQRSEGLRAYGNGDRVRFDRTGRSLADYEALMADRSVPIRERKAVLAAEPLFPTRSGGFYSSTSGIVDVHYAPAMRLAGLPTRSHYIRHAGVNAHFAYVDSLQIGKDERREMKIAFGVHLGWAWPEVMLEWYSGPARQREMIDSAAAWLRDREASRAAATSAPPAPMPVTTSDSGLSMLARVRALAA